MLTIGPQNIITVTIMKIRMIKEQYRCFLHLSQIALKYVGWILMKATLTHDNNKTRFASIAKQNSASRPIVTTMGFKRFMDITTCHLLLGGSDAKTTL